MKTILILAICCSCICFCRNSGKEQGKRSDDLALYRPDTLNYETQIEPILRQKCSPCHFPGGKMYEKLPFDKGATIIDHEAGILRRIKDEQKVLLIKQYVNERVSERQPISR